ncbi:unnamed protein product [Toxocara canis]|uniref:Tenascin-X n=1 Tax=Toxocara canis TaxID=6265 RepID=A0A183USK2_TOXCA|nr:unnamed protein product [Toxocara canis]
MRRMIFVLLSGLHSVLCERCPIIIGDFECPVGYKCVDNQCSSPDGQLGSADCKKVNCPSMTRCFKGRCYSTTGLTCNRNVLLDSSTAESIISNCGDKGKCINGRCVEDSCAHVVCSQGSLCTNGACAPVVGRECSQEACEGGTVCVNGHCVLDPCTNRCPADHECRLGECRHLQGISCHNQCPHPYECIDGRCTRNGCHFLQHIIWQTDLLILVTAAFAFFNFGNCARKVCKVGEACENGLCVKVEDRFCTLAIRDCGERFECESNKCHDKLLQTV